MRILKVIHGYPMRYNAGSEVYSQTLCHGLSERGHHVHVFTREENSFAPDFRLRTENDHADERIRVHIVNNPRTKDRYRVTDIDDRFSDVLEDVRPDIVHIGHLNHLSTSLPRKAALRGIPMVYTLHDYWLMCPRGQFVQLFPTDSRNPWAVCDSQEDRKCAELCYARYFSGAPEEVAVDTAYWTDWVARRMRHMREMTELVDLFIAPARYLYRRYRDEFGLPERKLVYLDYGFDRSRMIGRRRVPNETFTFGYIGTHIPTKGIDLLLSAFGQLNGNSRLRIWGRPRGQDTEALQRLATTLPPVVAERIEWRPEYQNQYIVHDVFDHCDAIVVPSIWVENSPLVIHEAQQARIPVITANVGGMAEYVHHEVNGLLFEHRSAVSLASQMQRFLNNPSVAARLGSRGYLFSENGDVPDIDHHVQHMERLYQQVLTRQSSSRVQQRKGPWRITFDTNPDTCNLQCTMCEEHSPHSSLQKQRRAEGRKKRLMAIDIIKRAVAEAAPFGLKEIIPSTMGEPLLYDHFDDILQLCERYKIHLNLTTNGTFPRRGAIEWAKRIVPVTSDVKISWNGATAHTQQAIMVGSDFNKMVDNVRNFVTVRDAHAAKGGNRCRVTFQLTFLESNVAELADIVRLAVKLGVDRVKGHHLWAHFDAISGESLRRSPESIRRWNAAVSAAHLAAEEQRLPNGNLILLENIFQLDDNATEDLAPGGPCPFLGQEAWVSAVGRFDPCCAPDAQRRTLGEFGNLENQSLMEIWESQPYRELTATYRNRKLCLGCNMRKPIDGGV
ncbi:MAG: glycosyltransferase [Myxococcales bacterium]|nr:glycosyltransferase [Myxococcales bacterium]